MEWVGLIIWALVAAVAFAVAAMGAFSFLSLGVQSLFALGGFALCVLYIALEEEWLAWASTGMAVAAVLVTLVGVSGLVSDRTRTMSGSQTGEELAASLVGAELPLLASAGFVMFLAAVGVTTVG